MSRADRVAARLDERELDLLLVTDLTNLRYLTGFTGSNGMAILGGDVRRFVTDFRYVEQAAQQVLEFDREQGPQDFVKALEDGWPSGRLRLGLRGRPRDRPRPRPASATCSPTGSSSCPPATSSRPSARSRMTASRSASAAPPSCSTTSTTGCASGGSSGAREREVALALEHEMRLRGASDPSFPSIVASGPRGALPHAVPTDEPIATDTLVTLDIGAVLDGYCSDCTRTWATGETCPASCARPTSWCCARSAPPWTPSGPARRAARSTPWRAT